MIKLILQGGGKLKGLNLNLIIKEIERDISKDINNTNILVIPFARQKKDWKDVFLKYKERYLRINREKSFFLASLNLKKLKIQIAKADLIFIAGGSEINLKKIMKKVSFSLFDNKTIIGVSAGANIFSSNYYSNDRKKIEDGVYKLPIKTICHFNSQKKEYLSNLASYKKNRKDSLIAIYEGAYFVLFFNNIYNISNVRK